MAAKSFVANAGSGQKIVVLAQDYAFGESYVTDAQKVFGSIGDKVTPVLVPLTTTDFTPTALRVKALHPGLIFLAWPARPAPRWRRRSTSRATSTAPRS